MEAKSAFGLKERSVVSNMRKTKIVCTLGPATDDEAILRELMLSGMNVARLNMSHGTHEEHKRRADMVKKLRDELDIPVAILLDTKGPEIRTGQFKEKVMLGAGQKYILSTEDRPGDAEGCSIAFKDLPKDVHNGTRILVDDGLIEMVVESVTDTEIHCRVVNGGPITSYKGINVPGITLSMPYISEKDRADLAFCVQEDFEFIAASFTRSAEDIVMIRNELENHNCRNIRIIAKIENIDGVENIDDIIRVSDGIMVARGDLGVEIPMEEIPVLQKRLIHKAYAAGKQVITATQMLDSMIKNPRPTRAEATDVANAIYDGTSAIMLSGETAAGAYPIESVRTMVRIAERTENDIDYIRQLEQWEVETQKDVTSAISHATCTTAHDLGAVAIMTVSKTGLTARMISKFRPACPIISGTTDRKVLHQMSLSWGVVPIMLEEKTSTDDLFEHVVDVAEQRGLVKAGDIAVITAGIPLGISGTTNMLKVHLVGDVLVSGTVVTEQSVCGTLCVCKTEEEALQKFKRGDILVMPKTSNVLMPIIRQASGIVTEMDGENSHAAIAAMALGIPAIVGAVHATDLLKSGIAVKLDGVRGTIFSASSVNA